MTSFDELRPPGLEFIFEAHGPLAAPVEAGRTYRGQRRIIDIGVGRFEGPQLSGEVLPGGVDWQVQRHDGVAEIEARYVLRTDDGVLIHVVNRGLRHGPPDVMQRLARGQPVDPAAYYFRTAPVFEAPDGPFDWLNRSLFVCTGARQPASIRLRVYRLT